MLYWKSKSINKKLSFLKHKDFLPNERGGGRGKLFLNNWEIKQGILAHSFYDLFK